MWMPETSVWPLTLAAIFSLAVLIYVLSLRNPKITTVVVGPIFLYLVAGIIGAAQLHFMGTMLLSLCVVSYVFARLSLRGVSVSRTATTPVGQGDAVEIHIEVVNRDRLPKLFLRVRCPLPEGLRAEQDTFVIPGLWPGRRTVARISALAAKRGCYVLAPVETIGADPLDLFQFKGRHAAPLEVVVRPVPDSAPTLDLLGDDFMGTVAPRRVLRPGHGLDFHSLREYRSGDDVRTIDWKATARLTRLIAVEFEPMQVGDLVVALDNRAAVQAGDDENSTLERAISLAAGALEVVLDARGTACLRYLQEGGVAEIRGDTGDDAGLLDALARVEPSEGRLEALALDDVRGRTVLLVTPATGTEVVSLVDQVSGGAGRPVVLLIDAPAFADASRTPSPDAGFPRWQRRLLALLGFGPEGDEEGTSGRNGAAGRVRTEAPALAALALPQADPRAEAAAGALRDAGAEVVLVGPGGLVRQRMVRER